MYRRRLLSGAAVLTASASLLPSLTGTAHAAPHTVSPGLPARAEITAALRRVADQWIGAHTDPGDNGWANATFFSGLLALQRLTGSARYRD